MEYIENKKETIIKLVCTPFLKNRVTLAILNKSGTIPVEKEALTIISRLVDITCLVAFKIATGML